MDDPTECPGRISPNGVEVIRCWGEPHEGPHAADVCRPCMTCFGFDEHIKGCPEITVDADDPGSVLLMWDNAGTAWTAEGRIPDHITGPWRPARRRAKATDEAFPGTADRPALLAWLDTVLTPDEWAEGAIRSGGMRASTDADLNDRILKYPSGRYADCAGCDLELMDDDRPLYVRKENP